MAKSRAAEDEAKFAHHNTIVIGPIDEGVEMGSIVELRAAPQNGPRAPPINFGLISAGTLNMQTSRMKSNTLESAALVGLGGRH
jgi:hypothetical protein